jgi:hypothetical protein
MSNVSKKIEANKESASLFFTGPTYGLEFLFLAVGAFYFAIYLYGLLWLMESLSLFQKLRLLNLVQ